MIIFLYKNIFNYAFAHLLTQQTDTYLSMYNNYGMTWKVDVKHISSQYFSLENNYIPAIYAHNVMYLHYMYFLPNYLPIH